MKKINVFLGVFFFLCAVQQVKKLQAILKPMMLRRLKDDVEKNLAPKEETIIEVEPCAFERNCSGAAGFHRVRVLIVSVIEF